MEDVYVAVACSVQVSVPLAGMCVTRVEVREGGGRGEVGRVDEGECEGGGE